MGKAVLDNVRAGKVTPVELRALELKAEQSDPQAVEILGWIYARGVGVKPDLIKSFKFYQSSGYRFLTHRSMQRKFIKLCRAVCVSS